MYQVGHEFSSVEALWSQFENVMAKEEPDDEKKSTTPEGDAQGPAGGEQQQQ